MAQDESSEGRRYSYQTKKKPVDEKKKPKKKPVYRARQPIRNRAQGGSTGPTKPRTRQEGVGREDETKPTAHNRAVEESLRHGWALADRDKARDRIYANLPRPTVRRPRPPGGPAPMIEPNVGPVGQLREQVAHTYGQTPEAYKALRRVPIRIAPPAGEGDQGSFESSVGGYYTEQGPEIYINPTWGMTGDFARGALAHEQAHSMFHDRGYDDANRRIMYGDTLDIEEGPTPNFQADLNRWRGEANLPSGTSRPNTGTIADEDFQIDLGGNPMYQGDNQGWPTERYARTVELSPNTDRSNWPDYIRPYYKGYLQGMDTLSTGEPTPDNTRYVEPWRPDESGMYGAPRPNGSPYRNWR